MTTIIYFIRTDAPLYMDTYLPESVLRAFKALGIPSYQLPAHLKPQAI